MSVRIADGVAIVNVATEGAPFLNQAICARTAVTTAIERTVIAATGVRSVLFAIDGEVITEWDA